MKCKKSPKIRLLDNLFLLAKNLWFETVGTEQKHTLLRELAEGRTMVSEKHFYGI